MSTVRNSQHSRSTSIMKGTSRSKEVMNDHDDSEIPSTRFNMGLKIDKS